MNYDANIVAILKKMVEENPKGYHSHIKFSCKELYEYVINSTPELEGHEFGERVYWIINDIHEFPKCSVCGKVLSDKRYFFNVFKGYQQRCSLKCEGKDKESIRKRLETTEKRFGKGNMNNRKLACKTMKERYGEEYYMNTQEFREKSYKTCMEKYGMHNAGGTIESQEKAKATKLERYGDEFYINVEKQKETVKKFTAEKRSEIIKKTKETCLKKYGVEFSSQSSIVKEKVRKTNIEKYGVDYPNKKHDIRAKCQQRYNYNEINFDSSYELAYYIWLTDNDIEFEYSPNITFDYEYEIDGILKHAVYMPDFIVNGEIVEIKGGHFLSKDGKSMINPYDKSGKTNPCYQAKFECMIKNNVRIISEKEIKPILKYIKDTYGKDYLKKFKKTKNAIAKNTSI